MNRFSLLIGLTAVILIGGIITNRSTEKADNSSSSHTHEHVIELREDGFYPEETIITEGDTVTFTTTRGVPFWPASNIHPTHAIYSEFDPKRALESEEEWSFTFDKAGTWRYHDHTAPFYTGVIIVEEEGISGHHNETADDIDCENVHSLPKGEKDKCWDKILGDAVKNGGTKAAFEKFRELYENDRDFADSGCHWYAHRIGEEAYAEKTDNWAKNFPEEVSYCGYGFVHGFLEHGFREEKNILRARALCNYLDENLSDKLPRVRLNCFHAIGHGFVDDPPPQKIWGNPEAIIKDGLKVCGKISEVPLETRECFDGVFNTLVIFMQTNQYGLKLNTEYPLEFCKNFSNQQMQSCYYELAQVLNVAGKHNLEKISEFVKGIDNDSIAGMIMNTAAAGMIQGDVSKTDFTDYLFGCQKIDERLRLQCIRGTVGGLIAHGEPEKEYIKALNFCNLPELKEDERDACYEHINQSFKNIYTEEKVEEVCKSFDSKYKELCLQ